ncbi:MAG: hypothetical protein ACRD8U_00330, partial [Pyrinomonadaceae bacterium]
MSHPGSKNRFVILGIAATSVLLATYLVFTFDDQLQAFLEARMLSRLPKDSLLAAGSLVGILKLLLLAMLAYLFVRALNSLIFGLTFRLRKGFEAPTLVR